MASPEFVTNLAERVPFVGDALAKVAADWNLDNADVEGVARYAQLRGLSLDDAAKKLATLGLLRLSHAG